MLAHLHPHKLMQARTAAGPANAEAHRPPVLVDDGVLQVVSRQDEAGSLGGPAREPVWTGLGQAAAWQLGALGSSLAAAQTVAAARCPDVHLLAEFLRCVHGTPGHASGIDAGV